MAAAAYADAVASSSLRGDGIEEIGEQVERFPLEDFYVDKRNLLVESPERVPDPAAGASFDSWPDRDIVGEFPEVEGVMHLVEGYNRPSRELAGDIMGNKVEDEDRWYVEKYSQLPRKSSFCDGEDESEFKIMLTTDEYGYEIEWKLIRVNGNGSNGSKRVAFGPPDKSNYADSSTYSGRWCLEPGSYKFQLIDSGQDGICSDNDAFGCGSLKLWLDGKNAGTLIGDKSNWKTKDYLFDVKPPEPFGGRIDAVDSAANGGDPDGTWCQKVRSVMKVPEGTCRLPDGRRGHRVRVTTKVDKYGEETSWTITTVKNDNGNNKNNGNGNNKNGNDNENNGNRVVRMKMGPIVPRDEQVSVEDCLPPGRYNLEMKDFDGICCRHGKGFFKLVVDGQELLDGGSFTKSIDHDFQLGHDWIAPMSERDCEWWWAHDYRRRDWHTRCYEGQYCGKSYRHLKYSKALAEDARVYAEKLLDTCDTVGILHDPDSIQGENLAKNKGSGNWGALYPADKLTKRFVDNEEFWGWNRNAHLTQAMWYSSRYLGCGESVKHMGGQKYCRMQVCRYVKAGNCQMSTYNSSEGNNWMTPMMMDDSPCGPMCASRDGCYH
eukprot:CAMPEP_0172552242 /NCGR_PEP_ID=MMETSP1067-20121228/43704_1 /TAXON_ID=265564 ORGANISM="Thalassiosira punctigera, Strain Tpunct2005C2" /NCGR_SAMPLE_ID=MMETSP1067 /ASSEMBLY_ACC=CAM_ASM_000444 /LENGTH=602 /DNA_ID=CAMNT_0013340175 /DNA_START=259 /DNA_END=2067 /DNA_ORIENTATION=-